MGVSTGPVPSLSEEPSSVQQDSTLSWGRKPKNSRNHGAQPMITLRTGGAMATVDTSDDKKKALSVAITQIERSYGKGSIMRMGSDTSRMVIDAIPTGAINLDAAIGVGGIPRGRITEIFGPE